MRDELRPFAGVTAGLATGLVLWGLLIALLVLWAERPPPMPLMVPTEAIMER